MTSKSQALSVATGDAGGEASAARSPKNYGRGTAEYRRRQDPWLRNTGGLLVLIACFFLSSCESQYAYLETAKHIPIQHNGRIKPLDSFSRQTLRLITSTENWQRKPAIAVMLEALSDREAIATAKWIRIDYFELKETLGVPKNERFFSAVQLMPGQAKIAALVQSSQAKRGKDVRPSRLEQKAEELYAKLRTLEGLSSGESIRVYPGGSGAAWMSPYTLKENLSPRFIDLVGLYKDKSFADFDEQTKLWIQKIHSLAPEANPAKLSAEVFYFRLHPFECAAAAYFLAFLLLGLFKRRRSLHALGLFSLYSAIVFHTLGIALRVFILSRPPVSNMYESMIFMNWALMIFATLFSVIRKNAVAVTAGALASGLVMLYANLLPIDSSMDVVVAVLRSNYWLTIHVMTVVSSYGAFGLAMALGHRHLILKTLNKFSPAAEEESAHLIERVIQLGTILIGTGTVLGGVWANESWGRFWGWDPKETWALITFLGYLIVIHLRYTQKLNNFGLALSSVLGFLLVLMTGYGVNFVLGRGLHSYGQGAGGMNWVVYYLILEAVFLGFILLKK